MKRYFLMLALPPTTRSSATKILGEIEKNLKQRKLTVESKNCHLENVRSYLQNAKQGKAYYICCYLRSNGATDDDIKKTKEYLQEHRGVIISNLFKVNHREYLFDGLKNFFQGPKEQKSE
jgi:hypothetical protein